MEFWLETMLSGFTIGSLPWCHKNVDENGCALMLIVYIQMSSHTGNYNKCYLLGINSVLHIDSAKRVFAGHMALENSIGDLMPRSF